MNDNQLEIERLRIELESLPRSINGKRCSASSELKASVIKAYERSGMSSTLFCTQLGIGYSLLSKWKKEGLGRTEDADIPKFKRVHVEDAENANRFTLMGPRGIEIRNLSLLEVGQIWRNLC